MGNSPLIGVLYHWIGGLASASNFIPFRPIKRWSWEIYWIVQGFAAWIVAPLCIALLLVPHLFAILHSAPDASFHTALLWGALWGVGGLTFGLSVRYLGIALGYAIALGLCTACGTLLPPLFRGQIGVIAANSGGRTILWGVAVCMIAIVINGVAGYYKERDTSAEDKAASGERDFSFVKGIAVAIFAGIMSSCFAYGLEAGKPIAAITRQQLVAGGRADLWQNLPVLVVVLWGGFGTNFLWSAYLILHNRSAAQFLGSPGSNPMGTAAARDETPLPTDKTLLPTSGTLLPTSGTLLPTSGTLLATGKAQLPTDDPRSLDRLAPAVLARNYALASLAGVIWYFQFFFYSMGDTRMGRFAFSSWALHMASIIIFATLWSIVLREWRGTSRRTYLLMMLGLTLLIVSTLIIGYGNYLSAAA